MMYLVRSKFFVCLNRGTQHEQKRDESYWRDNGPFESRMSAEGFARGLATQPDIAIVHIIEIAEA